MAENENVAAERIPSGIPGLDPVLAGGLARDRLFLIEGEPGTGKTTLALQFLLEGLRQGEPVLYITLAESAAELRLVAQSHGWSLEGMQIEELIHSDALDPQQQYTIFSPAEMELGSTAQQIQAAVEQHRPRRAVLDSLSELQLLAEDPLRYRRQVLALKYFLASRNCTTLLLDDRTSQGSDLQVRSVAHAVLSLELREQAYGAERRYLRVIKCRGAQFRGGAHDYKILKGGLHIYPRLEASAGRVLQERRQLSSGLLELDTLTGGGLEEGMSTLITGPSGTGKSTLAAQFVSAASLRGERCAMFLFEESENNLLNRSKALGMNLLNAIAAGTLTVQQIDPAELAPGQFTEAVQQAVDGGARIVVIDSLNGYLNAVPDERFLSLYLHELLTWLGQRGVVSILVGVVHNFIGPGSTTTVEASYLADNIIILRYFEAEGEVRQAISVFKKRGSTHERTIRRFQIAAGGIRVGPVLKGFRGILTGAPDYAPGAGTDAFAGQA
jgi:circadian clock protein KaiC